VDQPRGFGQVVRAGQELGFCAVDLQVGDVFQPLAHFLPRAELQPIFHRHADKALNIHRQRSAPGQVFEQRQIHFTGVERGEHDHPRLQARDLFRAVLPAKPDRLADAALHICRLVEVGDSGRAIRGHWIDGNALGFQFVQAVKILRVKAGGHGHAAPQALDHHAAVIHAAP